MFIFFVVPSTCRGEKSNFSTMYFQAFKIFPYTFDHGDGL